MGTKPFARRCCPLTRNRVAQESCLLSSEYGNHHQSVIRVANHARRSIDEVPRVAAVGMPVDRAFASALAFRGKGQAHYWLPGGYIRDSGLAFLLVGYADQGVGSIRQPRPATPIRPADPHFDNCLKDGVEFCIRALAPTWPTEAMRARTGKRRHSQQGRRLNYWHGH